MDKIPSNDSSPILKLPHNLIVLMHGTKERAFSFFFFFIIVMLRNYHWYFGTNLDATPLGLPSGIESKWNYQFSNL
jgi:hypothetical protein